MRTASFFCAATFAAALALPVSGQDTVLTTRVSRLEAQVAEIRDVLGLNAPETAELPSSFAGSEDAQWGLPKVRGILLNKTFFVLDFDEGTKVPDWVGYYLTRQELTGTATRRNDFHPDPELPPGKRSELADYRHSGYDRGHMAPAADFKRSDAAMSATFVLSNMAPQRPNLNRHIWQYLEADVRSLVQADGQAWIFTGPLYIDSDSARIAPADSIGPDRVAVPTHFFKVILAEPAAGDFQAYAFIIPNSLTRIPGHPKDYLVSVDHVEHLTGLDFFALLPDSIENRIERITQTDWPVK